MIGRIFCLAFTAIRHERGAPRRAVRSPSCRGFPYETGEQVLFSAICQGLPHGGREGARRVRDAIPPLAGECAPRRRRPTLPSWSSTARAACRRSGAISTMHRSPPW